MKLTEFDIDLPYVKDDFRIELIMEQHNCGLSEATKLDYSANWKDRRREFRLETRCITAMFERLFGELTTNNCWKIMVECVPGIRDNKLHNYSGVHTVQLDFDYDSFSSYTSLQKKQQALEVLIRGVRLVSQENGWDFERFNMVYEEIKRLEYKNEWKWKRPVKSPDVNYCAEVMCVHDVTSMDIYMIIKDKTGNEVLKELVISEQPDEFAYSRHLGKLKWISLNQVALVSKKGDTQITVSIDVM